MRLVREYPTNEKVKFLVTLKVKYKKMREPRNFCIAVNDKTPKEAARQAEKQVRDNWRNVKSARYLCIENTENHSITY
ncbi:MAG: hypothetical protein HQ541_20730 [Mariniphaga sp.]|nr:hypothetical protein [Mariniphaga sp.]